ncbi:MAG: ribbon-helix-helix domain-containing protein [Acidimicrobiales bacterium]
MTIQVMARVDERLLEKVDALVAKGILSSRSDAVRVGLEAVVDRLRRADTAQQIVDGYRAHPPEPGLDAWAAQAARTMIEAEPS